MITKGFITSKPSKIKQRYQYEERLLLHKMHERAMHFGQSGRIERAEMTGAEQRAAERLVAKGRLLKSGVSRKHVYYKFTELKKEQQDAST